MRGKGAAEKAGPPFFLEGAAKMRVGIGYDSHRFDPSRTLVLGGVVIPEAPGLAGHSDGDAIAHAVIDAILGAAAAGDVGGHFPPGGAEWKDADSMDLLSRSIALLLDKGYRPSNVDVVVVCEHPKISPVAGAIRGRLAQVLGIEADRISVKGKSNEGMGWIGSGEGLAVHAVALVEKVGTPGP
jgi:2-C-methyl-D-erythritol 2,4-cyclodiphosphate synthase